MAVPIAFVSYNPMAYVINEYGRMWRNFRPSFQARIALLYPLSSWALFAGWHCPWLRCYFITLHDFYWSAMNVLYVAYYTRRDAVWCGVLLNCVAPAPVTLWIRWLQVCPHPRTPLRTDGFFLVLPKRQQESATNSGQVSYYRAVVTMRWWC